MWDVDQGVVRGGDVGTDAHFAATSGLAALGLDLDHLLHRGVPRAVTILSDAGLGTSGSQGLPDLFVDPDETRYRHVAAADRRIRESRAASTR